MARRESRSPRLYVAEPLYTGASVELASGQTHYLVTVLRLKTDDHVLVFNGRDGEWRARLVGTDKRSATLISDQLTRPQTASADLHYMFAPLKHARLDYMVQKAVELGVSRLQPVLTRHTQTERVNVGRMRANTIEAAEQCGMLNLAEVCEPVPLATALERMDTARVLVFCDEDAPITDPMSALTAARRDDQQLALAVLIGPEGGFSEQERAAIFKHKSTVRLALGPRILRADTAAVAALTLVQVVLGDWR
ncbi:MAG: 16S rRNA (uracil(1498)-N(3))-methyltransferase [Bradyrhizobiaceae bacterium]|nr:16S rRNA (uracil(1498)-N(3))-methyltransferase [Bradyrhizobiaceae bacterium]